MAAIIERSTRRSKFGTHSLHISALSAFDNVLSEIETNADGGETWAGSCWVYVEAGTFTLSLLEKSAAAVWSVKASTTVTTTCEWVRANVTATLTAGVTDARLQLGSYSGVMDCYIDGVQLEPEAMSTPYCDGTLGHGYDWTGTASASTSTRTACTLSYPATNIDWSHGTLACWLTPSWDYADIANDACVWSIAVDADNYISLRYDASEDTWTADYHPDAANTSYVASTHTAETPIHLAVTWDAYTGVKLYVNGAVATTVDAALSSAITGTGTLYLGYDGTDDQINGAVDGVRMWDEALTAAQVASLYANELPVKTAGHSVGPVPYVWTKDGDNVVDNVDDTTYDNWCIVGGVAGDTAAKVRWEIDPATSDTSRVVWLGRKASLTTYTPDLTHWIGFTDQGEAEGDNYVFSATLNEAAAVRGRVQVIGGFAFAGAVTAYPFFRLGSSERVAGDSLSVAAADPMELVDFGDLYIDWPQTSTPDIAAGVLADDDIEAESGDRLTLAVAYWPLDEESGTRADSVGSLDLTDHNTVTYDTGKQGNAAKSASANSEYLSVGHSATLTPGNSDFSISAWVNLSSKAADGYVFEKYGEYSLRYDNGDDRFVFKVNDYTEAIKEATADELGSPSTGTWYHIVCYHDAAEDEIGIIVNGGTADTTAVSGGLDDTPEHSFYACGGDTAASHYYDGLVDEIGFWEYVLTATDIAALYNSGSGLAYTSFSTVPPPLAFLQLLPHPNCRVECEAAAISIAAGDTLVIDGTEAYMEDASDSDSQLYWFEHRGDDVTVEPGCYNYIFVLQGEEGEAYTTTLTATVAAYLTPRWLLPGGAGA